MPKKHHRIDQLVEKALASFPNCRDSDFQLWLRVMELAGDTLIHDKIPVELAMKYPHATVVRARANLQNKFHVYEASPKVRHRRQACCKSWTSFFRNLF